jgi:hypothetical protein
VADAALAVLGCPATWITHGSEVAQLKSWLDTRTQTPLPQ